MVHCLHGNNTALAQAGSLSSFFFYVSLVKQTAHTEAWEAISPHPPPFTHLRSTCTPRLRLGTESREKENNNNVMMRTTFPGVALL